jgi:hypothetical protein
MCLPMPTMTHTHTTHTQCRALGDVVVYLCFGPLLFQFTALLVAPPPTYGEPSYAAH